MKSALLLFSSAFLALASAALVDDNSCVACVQPLEFWVAEDEAFTNAVSFNAPDCPIDDWYATLSQDSGSNPWTMLAQPFLVTLANFNSPLTNDEFCKATIRDYLVDDDVHAAYQRAQEILEDYCGDIPATQEDVVREAISLANTLASFNNGEWGVSWCLSTAAVQPETGNVPLEQTFDSGAQAGILAGIIVGLLLLLGLAFYIQMKYVMKRK